MSEPDRPERPPHAPTTLVRIAGGDRRPGLIVAIVAIFLAVALIKPWPAAAPRPPADVRTPPPTEQPTADPLAAIREDCQDPPSWRVYSRERWPGGVLRSWRTLEPIAAASGPLDPAIPVVPTVPDVLALGFCAPWAPPERPPDDAALRIWSLVAGRPPASSVVPVALTVRRASPTLELPLGALLAPPESTVATPSDAAGPSGAVDPSLQAGGGAGASATSSASASTVPDRATPAAGDTWPAGTYVFAVQGASYARWWSLTIPAGEPAAAASNTPVP